MIENDRARKRRFSDAIRQHGSYLFILNSKSKSKKRLLSSPTKEPPLEPLTHRVSRPIASPSTRQDKWRAKLTLPKKMSIWR